MVLIVLYTKEIQYLCDKRFGRVWGTNTIQNHDTAGRRCFEHNRLRHKHGLRITPKSSPERRVTCGPESLCRRRGPKRDCPHPDAEVPRYPGRSQKQFMKDDDEISQDTSNGKNRRNKAY
ncbi:hypothetical protein NPIL_565111 [Nephila pilipes]|uniref:Uncharacterized protein n=1 Tax=Nephila pilipes TaxID=299642 RepID=A0A8X6P6P7_NEPPI|nr:hypothetical protein NPIL_565111 [Nephila pilipes]